MREVLFCFGQFTLLYRFRINCLYKVHPFLLVIELGLRVFSGSYSSKGPLSLSGDDEDEGAAHPHTHEGWKLMSGGSALREKHQLTNTHRYSNTIHLTATSSDNQLSAAASHRSLRQSDGRLRARDDSAHSLSLTHTRSQLIYSL